MDGYKKRTNLAISGMTAMLSCALLFSCNNEDFLESSTSKNTCDNICFGISQNENLQTRNSADGYKEGYTSDRFVLRSKDSADTLCVRTVVSDGICSSNFEKGQALTRGVSVSKENFYDTFHVLAYWKKNGTLVEEQFYMDEDVTDGNSDGIWSTANTYYWPGAGHTLQFYAWAPTDAGFTSIPTAPTSTILEYTVPQEAINQKDIVVAKPDETDGAYNQAQPLIFKHVCTAVRFAFGDQMQPGTIKSVALKGVYNNGTYNLETSAWTLDANSTDDFSQELNMLTTGTEGNGTAITPTEGTFMMLPQVLLENAMVEVVFNDQISGQDRLLTASIANSEWKMGTTVTYKLSISPEYNMNIEVPENEKIQDAHYVSFPITVNVEDFTGDWTLTSNLPNDIFFTSAQTDLQKQGYWIDEDKGQPSVSGTGNGTFTYYVYATENVADVARDIELRIKPADNSQAVPATASVQQLCPSWNNGNVGYERIEENNGGSYPFGFKWDRKVVFTASPAWKGSSFAEILNNLFGAYVFRDLAQAAKDEHQADYVTIEETRTQILFWQFTTKTTVTIDYSSVSSLNGVTTGNDGLTNTRNLYFHKGIGEIADIENQLRANAVGNFTETSTGGEQATVENFAARMAVMKNKFNKKQVTVGEGNQTEVIWVPDIILDQILWYLPASNEQQGITDTEYPLSETYWSSTATSDNVNAYQYASGSTATTSDRMTNYKIRAARKK